MATEYLMQKINILRDALQQSSLQKFQHELLISDAESTTGNASVDAALKNQAQSAMAAITQNNRQIAVRAPLLEKLQAEWDEQQKAVAEKSPI